MGVVGELFVLFGVETDTEKFKEAMASIKGVQTALAPLIHGLTEAAHGLINMALESGKAAVHILGTSAALGMSTKSIQEWSFIAEQAGSSIEEITVGISMFERNLNEFVKGRGSKRFRDAMAEMHISQAEVKADLAGPDGINGALFRVSDQYLKMGNTAHRAAVNTGLFGARAKGIAQDLGQGSGALRDRIELLHRIGGVIDEDKLQKLKLFANAINTLQTAWDAVSKLVVSQIAPQLSKMLNDVTNWLVDNREMIMDVLVAGFQALAFAFKVVGAAVAGFIRILHAAFEGNTGARALLIAAALLTLVFAGVLLHVLVPALAFVAGAIWTAFAPLIIPTLLIAAIIVAIIALAENWEEVVDFIKEHWKSLLLAVFVPFLAIPLLIIHNWDLVKRALVAAAEGILKAFVFLGKGLLDALLLLPHLMGKALEVVMESGKKVLHAAIDWLMDKVHAALRLLARAARALGFDAHWGEAGTPANADIGAAPTATEARVFNPRLGHFEARPPAGSAAAVAVGSSAKSSGVGANVSVGPTTININGVKDAAEAKEGIGDSIDQMHRHAASALDAGGS